MQAFVDGEVVKECMNAIVETMCPDKQTQFNSVSLSRSTTTRRTEDISSSLFHQLRNRAAEFVSYSLALHESTDISQLPIFVRGVSTEFELTEKLAAMCSLHDTTTGRDIFAA